MRYSIKVMVALCVISLLIAGGSQAFGQDTRKVLLIPREGYSGNLDRAIKMELGVMIKLLKEAGFQVDIATPSGQPIAGRSEKIEKVQKLSNIKLNDYAGIILVCMSVGAFPGPSVSSETVTIVKEAVNAGKLVAASASASTILAEAGVLNGKKYACFRDPLKTDEKWGQPSDQRYQGGIYSGKGVVQDGKIITSAVCPGLAMFDGFEDDTTKLIQMFIAALGTK
jgi:putative intracellular protease/amidase